MSDPHSPHGFDTVRTVLAVREYQDKPIPDDVMGRIVEAGHLSASASNAAPNCRGAGGAAEAEDGAFGTAAPEGAGEAAFAAGEAAVPAGVVCAQAVSDRLNTAATRILTNLLVIDPLDSFGLDPGYAGLYEQISTGPIGPPRRTRSASPVPGSSRRTSSVVTTQISWV